jgi:CheY-like chemotaxis protein
MDVKMPVLSGRETMTLMRGRQEGIRFIAQSAHALVGDSDRFLEEGFDAYLPKPFSTDQLRDVLKQLS